MIGKNNPFNIRKNKGNKWLGQVGSTKGFVNFDSLDHGIRAAVKIVMCSYRNFGIRNIQLIISRFAPSTENDTDSYIKYVVKQTQIPPLKLLNSEDQYVRVLVAMSKFEGNSVSPDQVFQVINLFNLKMSVFV